jgi:zinc protease
MLPAALLAMLPSAVAAAPSAPAAPITVPATTFDLPNGLHVILAEDHSVPFVWVNVWYWVGSKDEVAGRSGFAHLFEHLMFQGSEHANDDYFQPLQKIGGQVNGTTNLDRTNFFEGVPTAELPRALFLESDRMGWLLPALDDAKLQNQKDVVRNERRQRYDNVPYGHAGMLLQENVYPEGHPYHLTTIGRHEDIEAATLADVKAFFGTWYLPNNASLVIAGDFDPAVAKRLATQYFGRVPAGPEPTPRTVEPVVLTAPKVVRATDDVPFERVWLAWPSPALFAPGDAELDLLSTALADGKDTPLYRTLVREKEIAQDVSVSQVSNQLESLFVLSATVAPGHTGDELVAAIDAVLADVEARGVTADEVAVAQTRQEVGFYNSITTIQGKADRLNAYYRQTGNPDGFAADLARYRAATAESVTARFRAVVGPNRLELHIAPEAK